MCSAGTSFKLKWSKTIQTLTCKYNTQLPRTRQFAITKHQMAEGWFIHRPSCRSSDNICVLEMLSVSNWLRPENGPDENIDEVSDSYVVDDCRMLGRADGVGIVSWYSVTRCTILRDCTTSPIVGLWFASGATQAAAIVHTRTKSSFGYLPVSLGSASSSNLSLSRRIGRACNHEVMNVFNSNDQQQNDLNKWLN